EVDLDDGRGVARAEAFLLVHREDAVVRQLATVRDPRGDVRRLVDLVGASERAGQVRADVDQVRAGRTQPDHRVEARDGLDLGGGRVEQIGDLARRAARDVPLDGLREVEQGEDRGARPVFRVAADRGARVGKQVVREHRHQRSTPPITGSTLEITATV